MGMNELVSSELAPFVGGSYEPHAQTRKWRNVNELVSNEHAPFVSGSYEHERVSSQKACPFCGRLLSINDLVSYEHDAFVSAFYEHGRVS
jgi:hypothetical protein